MMKLIEADKVEQAIKDYWKAQVNKALTLTADVNEANKRINSYIEHNHDLLKVIDGLPSAEPDTTTHDSIPAKTGKNDGDRTSGDCISRTQAIDAVGNMLRRKFGIGGDLAEITIAGLPSAQPERKTGHWILDRSGAYCCDKCMEPCATYVMMKPRDKFCKMCGAKMESGEQDG